MRLFAGKIVQSFCDFRRNIGHISQRVYMGVRENTRKQALRLGLLVGQALERSDNPAKTCRKGQPLRVGLSNQTHIVAGML